MTFHSCCPQPHPAPRRRSYVLHARRAPRVTQGSGIRLTNAGSPGRSAESGSLSLRPECPPPVALHPDLRWIVSASVVDGFPGLAHRDLPSSTQLLSVARLDESLGGTCTLWSRAISGARWSRPAPAPQANECPRDAHQPAKISCNCSTFASSSEIPVSVMVQRRVVRKLRPQRSSQRVLRFARWLLRGGGGGFAGSSTHSL